MNKFIIVGVIFGSVIFVIVVATIMLCIVIILQNEYENEIYTIRPENLEIVET